MPLQQAVANFSSHSTHVYCCLWCPFDPDLVITGSSDCTLRLWRISSHSLALPSEGGSMWCTISFCLFSNDSVCVCVCVCVCEREREREREKGGMHVWVCVCMSPLNSHLISLWNFLLTMFEKMPLDLPHTLFLHFLIFTHNNSDCVG